LGGGGEGAAGRAASAIAVTLSSSDKITDSVECITSSVTTVRVAHVTPIQVRIYLGALEAGARAVRRPAHRPPLPINSSTDAHRICTEENIKSFCLSLRFSAASSSRQTFS